MRLRVFLVAVCVALAGACLWIVPVQADAPASASAGEVSTQRDVNCSDFPNQAAAQAFYIAAGGPTYDPHRLDSDHDGIACESLPCPCSTQTNPPSPTPSSPPPTPTPTRSPSPSQTVSPTPSEEVFRVLGVVEGDLVDVVRSTDGASLRVRLLGSDSPPLAGSGTCFGGAAKRSLAKLLPVDAVVVLISDPTRPDSGSQLLRYVERDGVDTNRLQLRNGSARLTVVGSEFARQASYRAAQKHARRLGLGLWGAC
jgi:endonuclease YncB( thermonuclease family)